MTRLIACCDGTWNHREIESHGRLAPTNVCRFANVLAAVDDDGGAQTVYYHPGIGTEGSLLSRVAGGAWGAGLDQNILSAYVWLAQRYAPGDRIALIGFSRGAYTVRSLAGMIGRCGLLDLRGEGSARIEGNEAYRRAQRVYERGYRGRRDDFRDVDWRWHPPAAAPIDFLGVWDTVGALGVPNDLALLNLLDRPDEWRFHDTSLGANVHHARHALALDEERASFTPTRWSNRDRHPDARERWFAGCHADVGGGNWDPGLSDIALDWMISEADALGYRFAPGMRAQVAPDPRGQLHESYRGMFAALRNRPRAIPPLDPGAPHPEVDPSVYQRMATPPIVQAPYRGGRILAPGSAPVEVAVYARERWNDTGLYLPPGRYALRARGEWIDKSIPCGPAGSEGDGRFHWREMFHYIGSAVGRIEEEFKALTGNQGADFLASKRHERLGWMALVGVIANDGASADQPLANPGIDGSPHPHEHFLIGDGCEREVAVGGYLLAYANDAWGAYGNNRGRVALTVERLA